MTISTSVVIAGETVDITKPNDVVVALQKARLVVSTGGSVEASGFGDESTTWQRSNLAELKALIKEYQAEADQLEPPAKRRRYAKAMRF